MPDIDITSAARSVAAHYAAAKDAGHTDIALSMSEVAALLPVLDALAARPCDDGRVERWARAMCADARINPDGRYPPGGRPQWEAYIGRAEQAIALADAERAAKASTEFAQAVAEFDREHAEGKQRMAERRAEMRAEMRAGVREPTRRFKL